MPGKDRVNFQNDIYSVLSKESNKRLNLDSDTFSVEDLTNITDTNKAQYIYLVFRRGNIKIKLCSVRQAVCWNASSQTRNGSFSKVYITFFKMNTLYHFLF